MKTNQIYKAIYALLILTVSMLVMNIACSGSGDPTGALPDVTGMTLEDIGMGDGSAAERLIWGGYMLEINPYDGTAEVRDWDRSLAMHFDVTDFVTKPACSNCLKLENFSFDKSAGVIDLDAVLVNATVYGGYDVRAVLLIDEWETGRRLENEAGLTDVWSGDPYHPDPFILFGTEAEDRYFAPMAEHSSHVTLSFPTPAPYNLIVPFIVDASYPSHPAEPVEITNITVEGSIHPSGYDLTVTADLLDWQGDAQIYLDCSNLNPLAGLSELTPNISGQAAGDYEEWVMHIQHDATNPNSWLPQSTGEYELPIVALDPFSSSRTFARITLTVTEDTEPPQWTGEVGIEEVWWGSQKAVVSFYPATDPSGPVLYNIYSTTDIPLIPPGKATVTGWSHYAMEIVDGAEYTFVVRAEDQAGNEDDNGYQSVGMGQSMDVIWEQVFSADLESTPNIYDIDNDDEEDVIFGCDNGKVYNVGGNDGVVTWQFQTESMVKGTPAISDINDDGTIDVVVGSYDSNIYAINTVFMEPYAMATLATGGMIESSPVCADQTGDGIPEVIVGSHDNNLYVFDGDTGEHVTYDTGAPMSTTPALEDFNNDSHLDAVLYSGGVIRAVDGISGNSIWSYNFDTGFSAGSPALADLNNDGTADVIIGSLDGVYALDIRNQALLWGNESLAGDFDTCPALGDITGDGVPDVAISSRYSRVFVLDGSDGALVWASDDDIYMPTAPVLADMNNDGQVDVVVGSADFYLRVINGADGYTIAEWGTSPYGAITTVPLITDVNSDGDLDIIYGTEGYRMFAITTNHPVPTDPDMIPWPKFMRDEANTGNFEL